MRTIERTSAFRRDYRRTRATPRYRDIETELAEVVAFLADDKPLGIKHRDHNLSGGWRGCRECHLKPDLLLIYAKPDDRTLTLVRIGSHSELFAK